MVSGNSESGITVSYQDSDGTLDFSVASQTDNNFTTTLKNKLDGIASGATNVTNNNQLTNGAGYTTFTANQSLNTTSAPTFDNVTIANYIYHQGDTNTFIGFESNDTIRFNTNGSDKLKINSSGHLILADDNDTYINRPSSNTLRFTTGGSTRLTINSSGISVDNDATIAGNILSAGSISGASLSVSGTSNANPVDASTSSDFVGRFASTDAVARLIIQDNSSTNNGNGIQVQGNTLKLLTGNGGVALTCDADQNVTIGTTKLGSRVIESINLVSNKVSAASDLDIDDGNVFLYSFGETANATPNITSTASSVNSIMAVGDSLTITLISPSGGTGYFQNVTIDGSAPNITKWLNDGEPSSASSSGDFDVYTYQIFKTAATPVYVVLANRSVFK